MANGKRTTGERLISLEDKAEGIPLIEQKLDKFIEKADEKYVTKTEFDPVKRIVFGVVTIILMAVAGAVVGLVILPHQTQQVTQNAQ